MRRREAHARAARGRRGRRRRGPLSQRDREAPAVAQDERGKVVLAGAAAGRLQVVPYGPSRGRDAVEQVRVSVQRLGVRQLPRCELAQQLDVGGAWKRGKHLCHVSAAAGARQCSFVVREGLVDHPQARAGRGRIELSAGGDKAPEDEGVTVVVMRSRVEKIARQDDRSTGSSEVPGDVEFANHVARIDTGSAARHTGDQRQRL